MELMELKGSLEVMLADGAELDEFKTLSHEINVLEPFFTQLKDGSKMIIGTLCLGDYERIKPGTLILLNKYVLLEVQNVQQYASFRELLETEGLSKVLPVLNCLEDGLNLYKLLHTEENGVIAISVIEAAAQPYISLKKFLPNMQDDCCWQGNPEGSELDDDEHLVSSQSEISNSRILNDFKKPKLIGIGGFGIVFSCRSKLDRRKYAVKLIPLGKKDLPSRKLSEVVALSRLQHRHVVRYYQAWVETIDINSVVDTIDINSVVDLASSSVSNPKSEQKYLHIQMEYCPRTLHEVLALPYQFDENLASRYFRQLVEGFAHIHGRGIIHRDLTSKNIFIDKNNEIKIGDFGLAEIMFELSDSDATGSVSSDATGSVSSDATGSEKFEDGVRFYMAPEIKEGKDIDEKADMYSLGVILFELWHPCETVAERYHTLHQLELHGTPPPWFHDYPVQAMLLERLLSPNPLDRPSATDLLEQYGNIFPYEI